MAVSESTVSVVMATYNGEKFVSAQVNSILNQTFKPCELIISDDGSSDKTLAIVENMLRGTNIDSKIFQNNPGLGFRDNFIHASLRARGKFIAFSDQDDVWDLYKLEKCAAYFNHPGVTLIAHSANTIDENARITGSFSQGITKTVAKPPLSYDPWMTFFGFSMVFRKDLLDVADNMVRFIDFIEPTQRIAHDRWIVFLSQVLGTTVEIAEPLVGYRQHANNVFGAASKLRDNNNSNVFRRSQDYISATSDMIKIVEKFPFQTRALFPDYDEQMAIAFLSRALNQLLGRSHIYGADTTLKAAQYFISCVRNAGYRSVHNNKFRWRSLVRDLQYMLSPNH